MAISTAPCAIQGSGTHSIGPALSQGTPLRISGCDVSHCDKHLGGFVFGRAHRINGHACCEEQKSLKWPSN
jgi:hypothetical protein